MCFGKLLFSFFEVGVLEILEKLFGMFYFNNEFIVIWYCKLWIWFYLVVFFGFIFVVFVVCFVFYYCFISCMEEKYLYRFVVCR